MRKSSMNHIDINDSRLFGGIQIVTRELEFSLRIRCERTNERPSFKKIIIWPVLFELLPVIAQKYLKVDYSQAQRGRLLQKYSELGAG